MLVNYILMSVHIYWAQIFFIPSADLKKVEKIYRAYVWGGDQFSYTSGKVAWDHVCLPKYARGLGLRQIPMWNWIAVGRYIWAFNATKDCLCTKWVNELYLKDGDWWSYQPSND